MKISALIPAAFSALRPTVAPSKAAQSFSPVQLSPRDQLALKPTDLRIPQMNLSLFGDDERYLAQLEKVQHVAPSLQELPDFSVTPLKVGVALNQTQSTLKVAQGELYINTPQGKQPLAQLNNDTLNIEQTPAGFVIKTSSQNLGPFQEPVLIDSHSDISEVQGSAYRGDLEIVPAPQNTQAFHVLNQVMLEDYLLSVVPSESPASWPEESLKAQSMAARTYAVANWQKRADQGYDLNADTSDQMYKGISSEHPRTNAAVKATAHQILTYDNKPITALFFSTSGGHTDSALEVWGVDLPYIQPVKDYDQASSRYRWTTERSAKDLENALQKLGHDIGPVQKMTVLDRTAHGRVKQIAFEGPKGQAIVNGNKFRFAARLYSTWWTGELKNGTLSLSGGGWGHGLGMSQYGARQMALNGHSAEKIVKHYYTGIDILSLESTPAE